jgi:hypothetical protein
MRLAAAALCLLLAASAGAEEPLPDAKPVPAVQVLPLPHDQASFQHAERELTRFHFGKDLRRPFWYPLRGPAGRSLTRMGHPHDPFTHSHHNSVWISHANVEGVNFWADHGKNLGRIVVDHVEKYTDGDQSAAMLCVINWLGPDGRRLLVERRRCEVIPQHGDDWLMLVDLRFEAPGEKPVTINANPFGVIGVRMAKTIGVHDGGGRILNSRGAVNEKAIFRKPTRWVDYSGRVTNEATGGVTLMDHPQNVNHPAPFHVRDDGWMGACLTLDKPITIAPDKPLRLRYGLWSHAGVPDVSAVDAQWQAFQALPLSR